MEPTDADGYFGKVLRGSPSGTRLARAQALTTYFLFLELRHKVEIHRMTGRVIECPIEAGHRVPDRRDEPTAGIQGRRPADPADRAGDQDVVHRLG
ncbi:hypothetical protein ACFU9X_24540 [Streptomyces atratus]|uniref:hypothetical protein n=1 Tax=Streptomyces atratus TaxID=1893 RepID=UPI0036C1B730